ncbi:zinc finger protein 575-like [Gouania willdenowi]|uniref:zinc finger protein 575-like n=1 Tax=Gouania willdenowi TaxID=441366 RepID=UPI001055F523|nr:zinc finger protein 575-like [Gouania willdenowi]
MTNVCARTASANPGAVPGPKMQPGRQKQRELKKHEATPPQLSSAPRCSRDPRPRGSHRPPTRSRESLKDPVHPATNPNPKAPHQCPTPPKGGSIEPPARVYSGGAKAHAQKTGRTTPDRQPAGPESAETGPQTRRNRNRSSTDSSPPKDNGHIPGHQGGSASHPTGSLQHRPSPPECPKSPFIDVASMMSLIYCQSQTHPPRDQSQTIIPVCGSQSSDAAELKCVRHC